MKQAKSGHYPLLDLTAAYLAWDENINFIFPAATVQLSPINLGILFLSSLDVGILQQNIKTADKRNALAELNPAWPLYAGGKISIPIGQAEAGIFVTKGKSGANNDRVV